MSIESLVVSVLALLTQSYAVCKIVFNQIKVKSKTIKSLFFIVVWLYCLTSCFFIPNQFRFVLFVTVLALIMRFILKIKDKNVILYAFNTEVIMSASEIIISFVLVIFGMN